MASCVGGFCPEDRYRGSSEDDATTTAIALTAGGFVPGVGEAIDVAVLLDSDSTLADRGVALASLGVNFFTAGFAPNFGGAFRAGRELAQHGDELAEGAEQLLKNADAAPHGKPTQTTPEVPRGGIGPVNKGKAGEKLQEAKALAEGDKIKGAQPTLELPSGKRSRPDLLTESAAGKSRVREAKNGAGARLTENQKELQEAIQNGQPVIPRGKRAADAGLEPGVPAVLDEFIEDRF